jgi:hypothetical protein
VCASRVVRRPPLLYTAVLFAARQSAKYARRQHSIESSRSRLLILGLCAKFEMRLRTCRDFEALLPKRYSFDLEDPNAIQSLAGLAHAAFQPNAIEVLAKSTEIPGERLIRHVARCAVERDATARENGAGKVRIGNALIAAS